MPDITELKGNHSPQYISGRNICEQNFTDSSQRYTNQTGDEESKENIQNQFQNQSSLDYKKNDSKNNDDDFNGIIYSPQSCDQITKQFYLQFKRNIYQKILFLNKSTCKKLFTELISMMDGKKMPNWVPNGVGMIQSYQEIDFFNQVGNDKENNILNRIIDTRLYNIKIIIIVKINLIKAKGVIQIYIIINFQFKIGFDLVLSILKQAGRYIRNNKQIMQIIQEKLVPIAIDNIKSDYSEYKFGIRIIKLCCRLTYNLRENQIILTKMQQIQKQTTKIFIFSYVYCEYFNLCLSDTKYIKELYQNCLNDDGQVDPKKDKGILQILECLHVTALNMQKLPDQEIKKIANSNIKSKIIDRNEIDFNETPQISLNMLYKILVESSTHFTESLLRLFQEKEVELINLKQKLNQQNEGISDQVMLNSKLTEEFEELVGIIEMCWKENLRIIKRLLSKQVNEQLTQNILKSIQSWIHLAGTLELNKITDEYLKVLSNNCINAPGEEFTSFNMLCTKLLFNIASCLGNILRTSSWHIILQAMSKLDVIFMRKLQPEESVRKEDTLINSDIQIQLSILNNLFSASDQADDNQLVTMIDALNLVNLSMLEAAAIEQSQKKSQEQFNQKFGFLKMIELFWDLVATNFHILANQKYNDLRLYSIDILNNIINGAFDFFMNIYTYNNSHQLPEEFKYLIQKFKNIFAWNPDNWQETLLTPYKEIITSQFPDTKLTLLENCLRLLQNNGHQITQNGLKIILEVLRQVSICSEYPNIVVSGQKCLELIISQHIGCLNFEQLKIILDLIENFRKNSTDSNSIYLSVELIWNIGDHLGKLNDLLLKEHTKEEEKSNNAGDQSQDVNQFNNEVKQFENLWENIFIKLILLTNESSFELRQSAIQTLSQLFIVNTRFFRKKFWVQIVKDVIINQIDKLMQRIIKQNDEMLNQIPEQQTNYLQTPKFFGIPETPKFLLPSDRNKFNNHFLNQEMLNRFDIKSFEESISQLIQSLQKIIKKGMNIPSIDEHLIDLYMNIIHKLKLIVVLNNQILIFEFLKVIQDFCKTRATIALKIFEEIKVVFADYQQLMEIIGDSKEENKIATGQVIPVICEIYSSLLSVDTSENLTTLLIQSFTDFLKNGLKFSKDIEARQIGPMRFSDDKPILGQIKNFLTFIFDKSFVVQNQILLFINGIINTHVASRFDYLVVKTFLDVFSQILLDSKLSKDLHDVFVKYFFTRIENLLELRFDKEYYLLHRTFPKDYQALWIFAFNHFIVLSKSLISKNIFDSEFFFVMENLLQRPKDKIEKLDENNRIYLMNEIAKIESICIEFIIGTMLSEDQELEQYVISRMIEVLETYIDSKKHDNLNSFSISSENSANQSLLEENEFEVRKQYIQNLFLLSKNKQSKNPKFDEVSRFVLPILILRCIQIMEDFIKDEQLNVSFPISMRRVQELVYVLIQLKELELPYDCFKQPQDNFGRKSIQFNHSGEFSNNDAQQNESTKQEIDSHSQNGNQSSNKDDDSPVPSFNTNENQNKFQSANKITQKKKYIIVNSDNPFIKGKKGHLIYMFSLFTDLIMTNQVEVKKTLQDIFKEIQQEMNLSNTFVSESPINGGNLSPQFAQTRSP